MDPDYERRLRDEVIYLHSLWHQGPPRPPQQPTPSRLLHHPSNPTQFKKKERIKTRNKKVPKPKKNQPEDAQNTIQPPSSASGNEWPCNSTSDPLPAATSDWPGSWPQPNSQTLLPSSAEKAKLAASQAQFKALQSTRKFFQSDDGDSENDDDDDDDDLMEEEQYRFFVELFMEDSDLRNYYEKNYYNGEFSCLVCGGMGKKLAGKKFKDCVALVQHSISIAKTKKRRAHRAHGQAICKVLGWDIARLPNIVSELSEKRELSLTNPGQDEVEDRGKSEAQASVAEGSKDGFLALECKEDSINVSNSGQGKVGGECKGQLQENVGEGTRDAPTFLESKEGSMDVDDSGQGEVGGKGKGKANVGEGSKDGLRALESKEDSLNVSESGQCEAGGKGECKARENVGEGTMDASNNLESKEGTMEVDGSGQGKAGGEGEGEDKGKANAGDVTDNDLTYLENKKALVDASVGGELLIKKRVNTINLPNNDESTFSDNSLSVAEASTSPEDLSRAAPEDVENKEAGLLNDGEPPIEECIVGEEGEYSFLDDLVKIDALDAPSWQESSGGKGNNNQTC